ncbi:ubiquitin-conjugating enzyme E2 U-like isoform X2 [Amia ocellicauda]
MRSRAQLLLEREYLELQKASLFGIVAEPTDDSLLEWVATIGGLKDSLWEGGVLQLSLHYSEGYNSVPPAVRFNTIPFHPNVDKDTGRPCLGFLYSPDEWDPGLSVRSVLLALQVLLSNPVLEDAVNVEAAEMLRRNPSLFRQAVLDCVRRSRRLQSGRSSPVEVLISPPPPGGTPADSGSERGKSINRISFEEYLKTWSGIATTKATVDLGDTMLEELVSDSYLHAMHYGLQGTGISEETRAQSEEFKAIMYGPAEKPRKTQITIDEKLARIHQMKRVYLLNRAPGGATPPQSVRRAPPPAGRGSPRGPQRQEHWEIEVDSLVAWTDALSTEELEED